MMQGVLRIDNGGSCIVGVCERLWMLLLRTNGGLLIGVSFSLWGF